ncbi:MAG: beta strand repeat-containing protein [Opitutaceae bacterium]
MKPIPILNLTLLAAAASMPLVGNAQTTIRTRTRRFLAGCGALLLLAGTAHGTTETFGTPGAGGADSPESWVVPAGITSVKVEMWGGGASGGNQRYGGGGATGGGSGGGGGGYSVTDVAVTPGDTINFTVGGGGVVAGANNADGLPGGDSIFPGALTATGGSAFSVSEADGNGAANGVGGDGGTGTFAGGVGGKGSISGSGGGGGSGSATEAGNATAGSTGPTDVTSVAGSAGAGGGAGAPGRVVADGAGAGFDGNYPGGGGSGGFNLNSTGKKSGGAGGNGQVTLTYFVAGADKLVITSVPASATAGADFSVTVQAQDSDDNPINVAADTEILLTTLSSGILSGNTGTITMGTDSVTLTGVQYDQVESIALTAEVTTGDVLETSLASSSIAVGHGPASQFVFSTQPSSSSTISVPFATQPVVQIMDAFGNLVTTGADATATVTISLSTGTGTLGGTTSVAAVDGQADFTDLFIDDFGTDKVLTASVTLTGPGLVTTDTSPAFEIVRDPAEQPLRWAIDMTGVWDTNTLWKTASAADVTAIPTDQLRFDDTYLTADTTVSVSGTVTSGNVQIANDAFNYTFDGSGGDIGGTTSLTKTLLGTLTMVGEHTFSGGINHTAGILNIPSGGASSASSPIGTGPLTIAGAIIDNTSGGPLTMMTNNPVTIGGGDFEFIGTDDLNFGTGAGTLSLAAPNTTKILTIGGVGSTLTFGGNLQGSNRNGGQTTQVDGAGNTLLIMGGLGLNAQPNNGRNNTWSGDANVTVLGGISGLALEGVTAGNAAHRFIYAGTGTFTMGGASTYTGNTTVTGGVLKLATGGSLNAATPVTINGGAMELVEAVDHPVASLSIPAVSPSPMFTGTYGHTDSGATNGSLGLGALDAHFNSGSGTFSVVNDGSIFDLWSGGELFNADTNGDGVDNGVAWILGAADENEDALALLPDGAATGGDLVMTFTIVDPIAPAQAFIEYSNDLTGAWTAVEIPAATSTVGVVDFVIVDNTGTLSITATIPASEASVDGALFGRLSAIEN